MLTFSHLNSLWCWNFQFGLVGNFSYGRFNYMAIKWGNDQGLAIRATWGGLYELFVMWTFSVAQYGLLCGNISSLVIWAFVMWTFSWFKYFSYVWWGNFQFGYLSYLWYEFFMVWLFELFDLFVMWKFSLFIPSSS